LATAFKHLFLQPRNSAGLHFIEIWATSCHSTSLASANSNSRLHCFCFIIL